MLYLVNEHLYLCIEKQIKIGILSRYAYIKMRGEENNLSIKYVVVIRIE